MRRFLLVGSSPVAAQVADWTLQGVYKVALNKAWALRSDFDLHVGLKHKSEAARPPAELGLKTLRTKKVDQALERAGGPFFTSTGVALNAGYWAVSNADCDVVVFAGCDMIYDPERYGGRTHFYGVSDAGPLIAQNHPAQMNPEARMTRLFCWALLHRIVLLNATYQPQSLLIFPAIAPDFTDLPAQKARFMSLPVCRELFLRALEIFSDEVRGRTEAFDRPWRQFPKHTDAVAHLERCVERWASLTRDFKTPVQDSLR